MAGGSERHQLDFEPHQAIAHVVPAVLRHALQVWRVSVAALRVPDRVEVGCDFTGQTLAGKLKHLATRQEPALQPLGIVRREDPNDAGSRSVESSLESSASCAAFVI
jgi:hypothetical protein